MSEAATIIVKEIKAKFDSLKEHYAEQAELVDELLLIGVVEYLLGLRQKPPAKLDYDPLSWTDCQRLADLPPKNVTHLTWQIISLCRISLTTPSWQKLASRLADPAIRLKGSVEFEVGTDLRGLFSGTHALGRFLAALLFEMRPSLSQRHRWRCLGLSYREQQIGYCFVNGKLSSQQAHQPSFSPVILYEDQVLESVSTRFLQQLKSSGFVEPEADALVFLYSSRNFSVYLSGIQEVMKQGRFIRDENELSQLRQRCLQAVSADAQPSPVKPLDVRACQDRVPDDLLRLTQHLASEIHQVWEHLFRQGFEGSIAQREKKPLAVSIIHNLHLCVPNAGEFLWETAGEAVQLRHCFAYRAGRFHDERGLPEYLFRETTSSVSANLSTLPESYADQMAALMKHGDKCPALEEVSNKDLDALSCLGFSSSMDASLRPQSRLRIPLVPPPRDSLSKRGILELYFMEPKFRLAPFADEIAQFVAKAHLVGKELTERVKLEVRRETKPLIKKLELALKGERQFGEIITRSPLMATSLLVAEKAAGSDDTILMLGESGVGKEHLAKAIHDQGPRAKMPFCRVDLPVIPKELIESVLFGHEKGAFTGATGLKLGRVEAAKGGTLFLDEIGDMELEFQVKLLRLIAHRSFFRVGGNEELKADVRLIAATNRDLPAFIREGRFRNDLYFRLNVIKITLPSLRQRREDIPRLASQFLNEISALKGHNYKITKEALDVLSSYHWPGNIRELKNAIVSAITLAKSDLIDVESLPPDCSEGQVEETLESVHGYQARDITEATVVFDQLPNGGADLDQLEQRFYNSRRRPIYELALLRFIYVTRDLDAQAKDEKCRRLFAVGYPAFRKRVRQFLDVFKPPPADVEKARPLIQGIFESPLLNK